MDKERHLAIIHDNPNQWLFIQMQKDVNKINDYIKQSKKELADWLKKKIIEILSDPDATIKDIIQGTKDYELVKQKKIDKYFEMLREYKRKSINLRQAIKYIQKDANDPMTIGAAFNTKWFEGLGEMKQMITDTEKEDIENETY
jgi:hypothetical protein